MIGFVKDFYRRAWPLAWGLTLMIPVSVTAGLLLPYRQAWLISTMGTLLVLLVATVVLIRRWR